MARPAAAQSNCAGGYVTVCLSGCAYTSVGAAVAAMPASLSGDYCVDTQEPGTLNEQVTIQNIATNNFRIIIGTETAGITTTFSPPAGSTAAFEIRNDSVTLANVIVAPSGNAVTFGVLASSADVAISSVVVNDALGLVGTAGISLANESAVEDSSVSVVGAVGLLVQGSSDTISYSTVTSNSPNMAQAAALVAGGAAAGLEVSHFFAFNPGGYAATLQPGSDHVTITFSTFQASAAGSLALEVHGSSVTVLQSVLANANGNGLDVANGANDALVSGCSITSPNSAVNLAGGWNHLSQDSIGGQVYLSGPQNSLSSSTVQGATSVTGPGALFGQDFLLGPSGFNGLWLQSGGNMAMITQSTITSASTAGLAIQPASGTVVTSSYIEGRGGVVSIFQSTNTTISSCTLADAQAGDSNAALSAAGGSEGTVLANDAILGSNAAPGVELAAGLGGASLSVLSVSLAQVGLKVDGPAAAGAFSVSTLALQNLGASSTGILLAAGPLDLTLANVSFDASVGTDVDASGVGATSSIDMVGASGPRAGSAYENDPLNVVTWHIPLRAASVDLAPTLMPGTVSGQPMEMLKLWSDDGGSSLKQVRASLLGNAPPSAVAVRVYEDANLNGIYDPGTDAQLAFQQVSPGYPPSATLSLSPAPTITGTTAQFFVSVDATGVPPGDRVGLSVAGPADLTAGAPAFGPFPLQSSLSTVQATLFANPATGGYTVPTGPTPTTPPNGGFDSGLFLNAGQTLSVQASGTWSDGVHGSFGPDGTVGTGGLGGSLTLGALVGRVGGGAWFTLGSSYNQTVAAGGELFLAMNTADYSLPSGSISAAYSVLASTTPKRWVGGTPGLETLASVNSNWSPPVRPQMNESVVFDAASWDCKWDIQNVTLGLMQVTTGFARTIQLAAGQPGVPNTLEISTNTTIAGSTLSLGSDGNTLIVHGHLIFTSSATLDLGTGAGTIKVKNDITLQGASFLKSTGGSPVTLTQDFGTPVWSFHVNDATVTVSGTGGLFEDARVLELSDQSRVNAFDHVRLGAQALDSPAVVLSAAVPQFWSFDDWQFNIADSTNVDASGLAVPSTVTFTNASGPAFGSLRSDDPTGRLVWRPDGGGVPGTLNGTFTDNSGTGGSFTVLATTDPAGRYVAFASTVSTPGPSFSFAGLPAPATYFVFAYQSTGLGPGFADVRGADGDDGGWAALPVFLDGRGGGAGSTAVVVDSWTEVSGSWTSSSSQAGPVLVQEWRGGDPRANPLSKLEASAVASPTGSFDFYAPKESNGFLIAFIDVNNDGRPDSFEGSASSTAVTLDGMPHTVNFAISGGSSLAGGVATMSGVQAHPGIVGPFGDQAMLDLAVAPSGGQVGLSALRVEYKGDVPSQGVSVGVYWDANNDGQLETSAAGATTGGGGDPARGAQVLAGPAPFGVYVATVAFPAPDKILAGATFHYLVTVDPRGAQLSNFTVAVASSSAFGFVQGGPADQPGLYPIAVGTATVGVVVPAANAADASPSGGLVTDINVFAGQTVVLNATGSWTTGGGAPWSGPAGRPGTEGQGAVVPSAPVGSLIARLWGFNGSQPGWFAVGSSLTFTSPINGQLVFAVNDFPGAYYDNLGQAAVSYEVSGSTTGAFAGEIDYTGGASGPIDLSATNGSVTISTAILVTGATYYPYVLSGLDAGAWEVSASLADDPNQTADTYAQLPLQAGTTQALDLSVSLGTGSVSGALSYSGALGYGDFTIGVTTSSNLDNAVFITFVTTSATGAYSVDGLPMPATYYFVAYRDADPNNQGPSGADPIGYFGVPGAGLGTLSSALTPVYVTSGTAGVNMTLQDNGVVFGGVSVPPTPGGADVVVQVSRGKPGTPSFEVENADYEYVQAPGPQTVEYSVDLLRPATDYNVFAFLDTNFDDALSAGEPAFNSQAPVAVPSGGSTELDFSLTAPLPPPKPQGFTAAGTSAGVDFEWTLVQGANQYELVTSSSGVRALLSGSTSSYFDALGANQASPAIGLVAMNFNGNSSTATVQTTYALAAVPASMAAASVSTTSAQLTWASGGNAPGTSYQLQRATQPAGPFVPVSTGTALSAVDSGLAPETSYYWRTQAVNGNGLLSAFSAGVSTFTLVFSTPAVAGTVSYAGGQAGAIVVQASTSSAFWPLAGQVSLPNLASQPYFVGVGSPGSYYVRAFVDVDANGALSAGEDSGLSVPALIPVLAAPATGYDFTIANDTIAPASPAGLAALAGFKSASLSWKAPTLSADGGALNDLAGYRVSRSTSAAGPFTTVVTISPPALTYVDAAAVPGVVNYYRVLAFDYGGNQSQPTAPTPVTPSAGGTISGSLNSSWGVAAGVYHVRLSTLPAFGSGHIADSTLQSFSFTGLPDGVYYVRAFQDSTPDGRPDLLNEPTGTHGGIVSPYPLVVAGGNSIAGADAFVCARTRLLPGSSVNGTLLATDCPAADKGAGYYTNLYAFDVGDGKPGSLPLGAQINVSLSQIDVYDSELILLGPNGSVVARNNQSGGAGLSYVVSQPGVYVVEPTSFAPGVTGAYTLALSVTGGYSGAVSGSASYSGAQAGPATIVFQLFTSSDASAFPVRVTTASASGQFSNLAYSFSGLQDGTYFVRAFRDSNGNNVPDPGEPTGAFGPGGGLANAVSVVGGVANPSQAPLTLTDPPTGAVSGTIVYTGAQTGSIRILIGRRECSDCGSIDAQAFASTGAADSYFLPFLPPATDYVLVAFADGNGNGTADLLEAKGTVSPVTVTAGSTTTASIVLADPGAGPSGGASFNGVVTYNGASTSPIFVAITRDPNFGQIDFYTVLPQASTFTRSGILGDTTYYFGAFMDLNGNGNLDEDQGEIGVSGGPAGYDPNGPVAPIYVPLNGAVTGYVTVLDAPTGVIAGNVSYSGAAPLSQNLVVVADQQGQGGSLSHRTMTVRRQAGVSQYSYRLGYLDAGTYSVRAYLDANGDGQQEFGEPAGYFGQLDCSGGMCVSQPVSVSSGAGVFPTYGVDMQVFDANGGTGTGSASGGAVGGEMIYLGVQSGPIVVQVFGSSGLKGAPLFSQTIPAPAGPTGVSYDIEGLPLGTYYVSAFRDVSNTGVFNPLAEGRSTEYVQLTASSPRDMNINAEPIVDPGGAGSLNAFTGDFASASGARFDGGSSDLAFSVAVDTYSAGGPFVYVSGVTTQLSGAEIWIVKYSSTGAMLAHNTPSDNGGLVHLFTSGGTLYGAGTTQGTPHEGVLIRFDPATLAEAARFVLPNAFSDSNALQGGAFYGGSLYAGIQDGDVSSPDVLRRVDPNTGVTTATGTYSPSLDATPHTDGVAIDSTTGSVYAVVSTGGQGAGRVQALTRFSPALGGPQAVHDVTSLNFDSAQLAADPVGHGVYMGFIERGTNLAHLYRFDASFNVLASTTIVIQPSSLVQDVGLAVAPEDGSVYLSAEVPADGGDFLVDRFTPGLALVASRTFDGFNDAQADMPGGLAVWDSSHVFVTGSVNNGRNFDFATLSLNMNASGAASAAGQTVTITTANAVSPIFGRLVYQGSLVSSGVFQAGLIPDGGDAPLRVATAAFAGSAPYLFNNVPAGTYFVDAFLDLNGNLAADAGEPIALNPANGISFDGTSLSQDIVLCDRRPISLGVDVLDSLGPSDCLDPDLGSPQRLYTFSGTRGQVVSIRVTALGFYDSVVTLYGPDGSGVDFDDDSGGDGNALLQNVVLPEDGLYTISAGAFNPGSYGQLKVQLQGSTGGLGAIAGSVSYSGSQGGSIVVGLFDAPAFSSTTSVGVEVTTAARVFEFDSLPTGTTYYLGAFVDVNANNRPDAGEDSAVFGASGVPAPIALQAGQSFSGAGISIAPSTAAVAGQGYVSGTVSYGGTLTGPVRVEFWSNSSFQGQPVAVRTLAAGPGPYDVAVPGGLTYYVRAYLDVNLDFAPGADEPKGVFSPNGQGAQPLFVPAGASLPGTDISILDPGQTAGGIAGEGSAVMSPATAGVGAGVFSATITYTAGPNGIAGGLVGFSVPPGFIPPSANTTASSTGTVSAVSLNGNSAFVTATLLAGQQVTFVYTEASPCALSTATFRVSSAKLASTSPQPLFLGSPSLVMTPGPVASFGVAGGLLSLQAGQLSGDQLFEARDVCGNRTTAAAPTTLTVRAKVFSGGTFVSDPSFGAAARGLSTATAADFLFDVGRSTRVFNAWSGTTGAKNLELVYTLSGVGTTIYAPVSVLPANALTGVSVSTVAFGVGQSSVTITPDNDGSADSAFINFSLGDPTQGWHVLVSSVPFKAGVTPTALWESWGAGSPPPGSVAWDGRYSPWLNGGGRVPSGLYFIRIEVGGQGVRNDSLQVAVSVPQLSGTVFDGGVTPNPPLSGVRVQLYGPTGGGFASSAADGTYALPGIAPGVYTVNVSRPDFLSGALSVTVTGAGAVSTFTALTNGVSAAINASQGLDIVMNRAPVLSVTPTMAVNASTTSSDRWGFLQVRSTSTAAVQLALSGPLRLPAGTTTFDDGGQWDAAVQQFVTHTSLRFNVVAGTYTVEAGLDGFASSTATVYVGASGASVVLPPFAAKSSIAGTITLPSNAAGTFVSVSAVAASTASTSGGSAGVWLDAGKLSAPYELDGLDAGSYLVRGSAQGFANVANGPVALSAGQQLTGVDLAFSAGVSIGGSITLTGDSTKSLGTLHVNAWSPAAQSYGYEDIPVAGGTNLAVPYSIPGLQSGATYQLFVGYETQDGSNWDSSIQLPASVTAPDAAFSFTMEQDSGTLDGTILLPPGASDFMNIQIAGSVVASPHPDRVGQQFEVDGATGLPSFTCVPGGQTGADPTVQTGYCPTSQSTATFQLTGQATETDDITVTYKTTGATKRLRLSQVNGQTTSVTIDLTGTTYSISGAMTDQISNPLFNTIPALLANAPDLAPTGYPADISSTTARVTAVLQNASDFSVAVSTIFNPVTSRVGFIGATGAYTIPNVPSGVYFVRTSELRTCATCSVVVPQIGRIVRVGAAAVSGVDFALSDGFSVSGAISLDGGLQDKGSIALTLLNRRQEVIRSTTVVLGDPTLGVTANSVSYSFSNLPPGDFYTLQAANASYVGRPIKFPDPGLSPNGLQASLSSQDLTLQRAAYITGKIRDGATGALIGAGNAGLLAPTFQITATADPWTEGGYAVAASSIAGRPILGDGSFKVGPLIPDVAYDLKLAQTSWDPLFLARGSQNYTPVTVAGIQPQDGELHDVGVVTLDQGQSLTGVVRATATLQALGNIKVTAVPSFGDQSVVAQTFTDPNGRYSLWVSSFVSSQFDVTAAPRDGDAASNGVVYGEVTRRNVTLQTGTTADFILSPLAGAVTGHVVVEDAAAGGDLSYPFGDLKGFPAAAVNLQPVGVVPVNDPLGDIEGRTDALGSFSIPGLSTGTYSLRVTSLGYSVYTATAAVTASGFTIYTGSFTPTNFVAGDIVLTRGATITGRIIKSDGSAPNTSEVGGIAAANFAAGEFVIGSVDVDKTAKTVNSYTISGFKPGIAYDLVILPADHSDDVSFPPEGRGVSFTLLDSTTTKNINLTFTPTGIDCAPVSKALGNNQFQLKISCTKALRNTLPADNDLDTILTVSTYTSTGAPVVAPNGTGQFLGSDKSLSGDRRQLTAIYRAGASETQFSIRVRATAATVDPATGANFTVDKVFDFYTGLPTNVTGRISNINGGSVQLEPSEQDLQLGQAERSRIDLKPGTFALGGATGPGVVSAAATIEVGLTKALDQKTASVLSLRSMGYVPQSVAEGPAPASLPAELYSAMQAYKTQSASSTTIGGADPLSAFYTVFLPAGVRHQLEQPADLTLSYDASLSSAAASDPDKIQVWYYNAVLGRYVLEDTDRRLDTVNQTITVSVDHFSTFVVLDSTPVIQAPNFAQTDKILAFNFPNPADCTVHSGLVRDSKFAVAGTVPDFKGTMIRYTLPAGAAQEAKIYIYDMAGEKIRTIEPGSLAGGITYYSPWDCNNGSGREVASGVYVGEVVWGGQKKFFKMAIVKGSGL